MYYIGAEKEVNETIKLKKKEKNKEKRKKTISRH